MVVTVSLVFLFGLVLFFLLRTQKNYGTAFTAVIFGFFLASTGAAGPIDQITTALVTSIQHL